VSLESWSSPRNREQLRSASSASLPQITGLGTVADSIRPGVLLGFLHRAGTDPVQESKGQYRIQRRYTEDWVLRRGYQQHRRASSSWYSESSQDLEEAQSGVLSAIGGHHRNISNAKTITPADYQQSSFLGVLGTEFSSDHESAASGVTGRYRTAPQSLVDFPMDCQTDLPEMPALPSRWADLTPSPVEDKGVNGFKMELPVQVEATPQTTPNGKTNGVTHYLLSAPKSVPTTRTSTPSSKKAIKWRGKAVVIQIPSDVPYGVSGGRPIPLSRREIEMRMKAWINQGYNTEIGGQGPSRDIYPEEQKEKVDASDIFVSIPDKSGAFVWHHHHMQFLLIV